MARKLDHEKQAKADRARVQGTEAALTGFAPEFTPSPPWKNVSKEMVKKFMREVALARLEKRPPPSFTEEMEYVFGTGSVGLKKLTRDTRYQKILRGLQFGKRKRTSSQTRLP